MTVTEDMIITEHQMQIIKFCADECAHQQTTPTAVPQMILAWGYLNALEIFRNKPELIESDLIWLGKTIEPSKNRHGFRRVPVTFKSGGDAIDHILVPQATKQLLEHQNGVTPEEFYNRLMHIHPFQDGNGRVGQLVTNYIAGSISNPVRYKYYPAGCRA